MVAGRSFGLFRLGDDRGTGFLDEVATTPEASPDSVLADAGYRKEGELQVLESREIDA